MDNHLLVSASSSQKAVEKPRTSEPTADGDAFAKILDKEVSGSTSKDDKKSTRQLVSGDEHNKTSPQQQKELEEQFKRRMGLNVDKLIGTRNFIYNLVLKDPATLNISERQALHLGEFSNSQIALKDFQSALSEKGLHLKDLSFTQISQLSRCHSKEELATRLDSLDVSHHEGFAPLAVRMERSTRYPSSPLSPAYTDLKMGHVNGVNGQVRSADKTQQAADARKKQREDVIRQVMVHIDVQRVANQTEVALKLNPEFLGDMKIKLRFEGHNNVAADFETTSADTKSLLDEDMDSLRDAFDRKGMTLTHGRTHLVETVS